MTTDSAVSFTLGLFEPNQTRAAHTGVAVHGLSRRELQVATLVSEGYTNREIGKSLFISERTVDNHVEHILEKLQFRSRAQIGAWLAKASQTEVSSGIRARR